jgi:hypothetical protein
MYVDRFRVFGVAKCESAIRGQFLMMLKSNHGDFLNGHPCIAGKLG